VTQAYLSAGSNLGNRKENLEFALKAIAKQNTILRVSSIFETEPVGYLDQPWFLNLAVEIETVSAPLELLRECQRIEKSGGRVRTFLNAPRTLDVDILLFGELAMSDPELVIPHPRMRERRFVLEPLAQIAPDRVHPILKKTIRAILADCPDTSALRLFE
jgi:2-amino-4-hydroxy-6-hydroxymethyldihydropteridine diphosphokinase